MTPVTITEQQSLTEGWRLMETSRLGQESRRSQEAVTISRTLQEAADSRDSRHAVNEAGGQSGGHVDDGSEVMDGSVVSSVTDKYGFMGAKTGDINSLEGPRWTWR